MGEMEGMERRERWVHQDLREVRETEELQVLEGQLGRRVCEETQEWVELRESQDCRAHQQEELSTLAGAGPPAPLTRELSSSMPAELGGLISAIRGSIQLSLHAR